MNDDGDDVKFWCKNVPSQNVFGPQLYEFKDSIFAFFKP